MSSGTETQAFVVVRTLRCRLQTCRVAQMSEVACTLAGKHWTDSQKDCRGHTRAPSPASLSAKSADPASQATGKQTAKVIKVLLWGTGPRATTLALTILGPLGWASHLHTILKDWANDRVNDLPFCRDTTPRRQQYGVAKSGKLPNPSDMPRQYACPSPRRREATCLSTESGPPL
jgi:hypothetical protein